MTRRSNSLPLPSEKRKAATLTPLPIQRVTTRQSPQDGPQPLVDTGHSAARKKDYEGENEAAGTRNPGGSPDTTADVAGRGNELSSRENDANPGSPNITEPEAEKDAGAVVQERRAGITPTGIINLNRNL